MKHIHLGFHDKTVTVPIDRILPTRMLSKEIRRSQKFQTILASIREVGVIEPLAVHPEASSDKQEPHYILLDGHLRLEALKSLDATEAVCLISTDDEGFTYNRQVNRLSAVQEHKMILKAIAKKLPPERIAQALHVDVERIRERQRLLDGIVPEAVELLKDRMVSKGVFSILRKMKPMRQIETAEMMISANRFTTNYAKMVLATTRPELLVDRKNLKQSEATPEDIARMEREMEKLHQDHKMVEDTLGETMLVLVVAKGYVNRLMRNPAIADYLARHHVDLANELSTVMDAIGADARGVGRE